MSTRPKFAVRASCMERAGQKAKFLFSLLSIIGIGDTGAFDCLPRYAVYDSAFHFALEKFPKPNQCCSNFLSSQACDDCAREIGKWQPLYP